MSAGFTNPYLRPGEGVVDVSLRPRTFAEFIGQPRMIQRLNVALNAAKSRHEALTHILFHGPPGLGKTSCAFLIADAMGSKLHTTSGPALEKASLMDIVHLLIALSSRDVLFVDEIHALPKKLEEYFHSAMERYEVDIVVGKGFDAKTITMPVLKFTLVGATTKAGALSAPLRDRFGLVCRLESYNIPELQRIVLRSAGILGVDLGEREAHEIAARARGTPRIANRLLARVRDYAAGRRVDGGILNDTFELEGIDSRGLGELDRAYIACLRDRYKLGPVGVNALAASLNESRETIEEVIEPFLLAKGIIGRSPRGRVLLEG